MKTPPNNPFADVEFYVNNCPYCQAWVWAEQDECACPKCRRTIHRRTLPYEQRAILCRDDQLELVAQAWDIFHGTDPELGRQRREREQRQEQARQEQREWDDLMAACLHAWEKRQAKAGAAALALATPESEAWRLIGREHKSRGALLRLEILEHGSLTALPDKSVVLRLPAYFSAALEVSRQHPLLAARAAACLGRSGAALEAWLLASLFPRLKAAPGETPYALIPARQAVLLLRGVTRAHLCGLAKAYGRALPRLAAGLPGLPEGGDAQLLRRLAARLEPLLAFVFRLPGDQVQTLRDLAGKEPSPETAKALLGWWAALEPVIEPKDEPAPQGGRVPEPGTDAEDPGDGEDSDIGEEEEDAEYLKALYRRVMKLCHPDLSRSPSEQASRNQLAALASRARDQGDLATLEKLYSRLKG